MIIHHIEFWETSPISCTFSEEEIGEFVTNTGEFKAQQPIVCNHLMIMVVL